jgi:hypothetical protein
MYDPRLWELLQGGAALPGPLQAMLESSGPAVPYTSGGLQGAVPFTHGGLQGTGAGPSTYTAYTQAGLPVTMDLPPGVSFRTSGGLQGAMPYTSGGLQGAMPYTSGGLQGAMPYTSGGLQGAMPYTSGGLQGAMPYTSGGLQGADAGANGQPLLGAYGLRQSLMSRLLGGR